MEDIATKKLNREKFRENLTRVRSNIQTIRESLGETLSDRPLIGAIRKIRQSLRGEASSRSPEYESTIEYDTVKEVKTENGELLRVYYRNGQPVFVEQIGRVEKPETPQSPEAPRTVTVFGEPSIATISKEQVEVEAPLPPRLVKRERLKLRLFEGPRVIEAVRGYIGSLAEREKLETEYHRLRLEHYRRLLENPPKVKKESESEARGGSHY
jgi:hypothetical protein